MPSLMRPDGTVCSPTAPAPSTKLSGAASESEPKIHAKKPPAKIDSSRLTMSSSTADARGGPEPPPSASEVQLKMWHAVLLRRRRQIQRLSHSILQSFANDIISDLMSTRYEPNEYTEDLNYSLKGGDEENEQGGVDLISGHYKSFLLLERPPPACISAEEIGLHLLALFYRTMDNRLPNAMRKHGLEALRRACTKLEFWISKCETVTEGTSDAAFSSLKRKRKGKEGVQRVGGSNTQSEARIQNASNRSNDSGDGSKKKMRLDPPELNVNSAGTELPDNTSEFQRDGGDDSAPHLSTGSSSATNARIAGNVKFYNVERGFGFIAFDDGRHDHYVHVSGLSFNGPLMVGDRVSCETKIDKWSNRPKAVNVVRINNEAQAPAEGEPVVETVVEAGIGDSKELLSDDGKREKAIAMEKNQGACLQAQPETLAAVEAEGSVDEDAAGKARRSSPVQEGSPQKRPTDDQGNSKRGDTNFPLQQKQPGASISKESGSISRNLGNRFLPPQKGPNEISLEQRIIRSLSSTSAFQGTNDDSLQSNRNKDEASLTSGSNKGSTPSSQAPAHSERLAPSRKVATNAPPPPAESQKELPSANGNTGTANEPDDDDDVIDLTEDSPSNEPPTPLKIPSAAANASSASRQVNKRSEEESMSQDRNVPRAPPSPPASPLPLATIHNPHPPPQPNPKPFSERRSIIFVADGKPPIPIASGSLNGRSSCVVSFDAGYHLDGSGSCLDDELCIGVSKRLQTWDPYWKIIEELGTRKVFTDPSQRGHGMTRVGTRTTPCGPARLAEPVLKEHPSSCALVYVDLQKEISGSKFSNRDSSGKSLPQGYRPWGVRWGSLSHPYKDERGRERDRLQTGDRRLILRTLPLQRTAKDFKKRADGHLWPKGTFLQLKQGGSPAQILSILQRKQQSHCHTEWKGMSHPLDLTLKVKTTNVPFELNLCSQEIAENSESLVDAANGMLIGSYAVHLAICEYVAPDELYDQLMGNAVGGDVTIPRISLRSARKRAKEYLADQTVLIDDSDDEDKNSNKSEEKNAEDRKSLTFSLICPISKTVMHTPVRGRHCKHMQCMDLRNFLHANKNVTGGRWRCGACEAFVNVRELVHCGLFQAMLDSLGSQVSGSRDRVKLHSDGSWKLMDENRLRYNKRGGSLLTASQGEANNVDAEVIELM